jgi:hypothetical protein
MALLLEAIALRGDSNEGFLSVGSFFPGTTTRSGEKLTPWDAVGGYRLVLGPSRPLRDFGTLPPMQVENREESNLGLPDLELGHLVGDAVQPMVT